MGKFITIEGTDCSGKQTQSDMLVEKLKKELTVFKSSFPMYDTPTGKIVGGPYLGKEYLGDSYFEEGAAKVDPEVAALYYAADRLYNIDKIEEALNKNDVVVLDRYIESNMAHQGGKIFDPEKRKAMFDWLENLEYRLLSLPRPDLTVFLYMPYEYALVLKENRLEAPDGHESSKEHLLNAEQTYLELASRYNFKVIECVKDGQIRSIEDINEELYDIVLQFIKEKSK